MISSYQRSKLKKNNKRLRERRKKRAKQLREHYKDKKEDELNNILYDTWLGQVKKGLPYEKCRYEYILQKERNIKELKEYCEKIDYSDYETINLYQLCPPEQKAKTQKPQQSSGLWWLLGY